MALGDKQVWVLGEPHMTNEDVVVIWTLGKPYMVIDSVAEAPVGIPVQAFMYYQRLRRQG